MYLHRSHFLQISVILSPSWFGKVKPNTTVGRHFAKTGSYPLCEFSCSLHLLQASDWSSHQMYILQNGAVYFSSPFISLSVIIWHPTVQKWFEQVLLSFIYNICSADLMIYEHDILVSACLRFRGLVVTTQISRITLCTSIVPISSKLVLFYPHPGLANECIVNLSGYLWSFVQTPILHVLWLGILKLSMI